jgi:hypothetical protein
VFHEHHFHLGIEWDLLMMRLEEEADLAFSGEPLTLAEHDFIELNRRLEMLMTVVTMYGRQVEGPLVAAITKKQDEWERVWEEVLDASFRGRSWG